MLCFSNNSSAKGPELIHNTDWIQGYFSISFSIYAGAKDASGVKRVTLCFRNNKNENFSRLSMVAHPEAVTQEGHTLYEATIPGSAVTTGLEYYIEAENTADQITRTSSYTAGVDFELELLPGIDAYPTLNRDKDHPDVRLLRRIPKLWDIIGSGADTSFGYDVPGQLWVPVELSDPGLRTLIELPPFQFADREVRKRTYHEVLFHVVLQDGLANNVEKQEKAWESLLDNFQYAAKAAGITVNTAQTLRDALESGQHLSKGMLEILGKILHSGYKFTGMAKNFAELAERVKLIGLVCGLYEEMDLILGDGLKAMSYHALMQCEARERLALLKRTSFAGDEADPALLDALNELEKELENWDTAMVLAIQEAISDKHVFNLASILAAGIGMTPPLNLFFSLTLIAAETGWFDIFKEADLLKLLIATATLEKSMYKHAMMSVSKKDLNSLLQMKYYLGYYYSRTHLLLEQKWTITIPHAFFNLFGLDCLNEINDRFEHVEKLQSFCVSKYKTPEIANIPDCYTRITSSTVLVIDTSGSMDWEDPNGKVKIEAAKDAAMALVNMLDTENKGEALNQVSLVTFNNSATLCVPFTTNFETVRERISSLGADGGTNLYDGLALANKQLDKGTGKSIIILLSDGVPTVGPPSGGDYKELEQEVLAGPVKEAKDRGYCIYVVGFGKPGEMIQGELSIDPDFLSSIVQTAGCGEEYHTASEAFELFNTYIEVHNESMGREKIGKFTGTVKEGETVELGNVVVPLQQEELYFTLTWPGSQLDPILIDPQGRRVDAGYPGATIDAYTSMVYIIISNPLQGTWQVRVFGRNVPGSVTQYAAILSTKQGERRIEEHTAQFTDPLHDAAFSFLDITSVTITQIDKNRVRFEMDLADTIPSRPDDYLMYLWSLDTDRNPSTGFAHDSMGAEFNLRVAYDPDPSHGGCYGWHGWIDVMSGYGLRPEVKDIEYSGNVVAMTVNVVDINNSISFDLTAHTGYKGQGDKAPDVGYAFFSQQFEEEELWLALLKPDGVTIHDRIVEFSWPTVPGAYSYNLQVRYDQNFDEGYNITNAAYFPDKTTRKVDIGACDPNSVERTLYWSVRPSFKNGDFHWGNWLGCASFVYDPWQAPVPASGINLAIDVEPSSIPADGHSTATVTAYVTDKRGDPVLEEQVRFVVHSTDQKLHPGGYVIPGESYISSLYTTCTNANGVAYVTYQAPEWDAGMAGNMIELGVWYHVDGGGNPYAETQLWLYQP